MTGSRLASWKRNLGGPGLSYVDSSVYTDPQIFEMELDKIWRRLVDMIEGVHREIMKRT